MPTSTLQFSIQYASISSISLSIINELTSNDSLSALLWYDYVLTFGMEVKYIWGEKFRLSTLLYICCRYGLVANLVYLFTIAGKISLTVSFTDSS